MVTRRQHYSDTRTLHNKLLTTFTHCKKLDESLTLHVLHIRELNEKPFAHDELAFRTEHELLEDNLCAFAKHFRDLKSEVMQQAEYATENDPG